MSWTPASEPTEQAQARELGIMLRRLVRAAGFAAFRLVPGDDERLLSYLHWLQHYSIDIDAVLEREPLFVLSAMDNWLRRVHSLRLSAIITIVEPVVPRPVYLAARALVQMLYPLYWITRAISRAAGVGVGAAAELEQVALKWIPARAKPIPRMARRVLFLLIVLAKRLKTAAAARARRLKTVAVARALSAGRLEALYPYARKCAYDLLVRNGDLAGAAQAFEQLSQVRCVSNKRERALDQFMLGMLATLSRIEWELAVACGGKPADLIVNLVLLDPAEADLFEAWAGPSLFANGNLPALPRKANALLHILAGAECRARLAASPLLARVRAFCRVRIDEVPPELVRAASGERRDWLKAALRQQSWQLAAQLDANLFILDPAAVYSENYLGNLREVSADAHVGIVLSSSYQADRAEMGSALQRVRGRDGSLALSARALHTRGLAHLHPASRQRLVTAEQMERGRIPPPEMFMWCEDDNVVIHTTQYRPLCLRGKSRSETAALCYWDVDSPLTRNWISGAQVSMSTHLVRPVDEIGFVETAAPVAAGVPMYTPGEFARLFWHSHTSDDAETLRRELRLPVDEIPRGIPRSPPSAIRAAFATFFDLFKKSSPPIADSMLSGLPIPMTMSQVVSFADAIYRFEVESGHGPQVGTKIEDLRARIRSGNTQYESDVDSDNLVLLAVYLLRLGLLHELVELRTRHALPLDPTISTFIDFCSREFHDFTMQGQTWRSHHPDQDLFVISGVVWGEQYVRNFMDFCVRSMLAPGNLPGIAQQGPCTVLITTDEAGAAAIRSHPAFAAVRRHADFRFAIVPDAMIKALVDGHLMRLFYMLYGMLDHIGIFFAQGARAHLFMIPVDAIVADGSFVSMADYRHQGFECCGGGNLVAETETFLPELARRYGDEPVIAISTLELASLAIAHPHHYFVSQVICRENRDFGKHARELFWPIQGGMEIHSCFIHPLFTAASALQRYRSKHFANVDYGMIPRMFIEPSRIKIIENTEEAYINNFASGTRRYETTGTAFTHDAFLTAHRYTYPVQKALFIHAQTLPCRYDGITPYRDTASDVATLWRRLRPATFKVAERRAAAAKPARAGRPASSPAQPTTT